MKAKILMLSVLCAVITAVLMYFIPNTLYSFLVAIGLCILTGFMFTRSIFKQLITLKQEVEKLAKGDLTVNLQVTSRDEFAEIGKSINQVVQNLRDKIWEVKDNTIELEETVNEINSGIEETSAAMEEVTASITEMANGAQEQIKQLENTANNIMEIAASIKELATNSQNIAELAQKADENAKEGSRLILGVIKRIEDLKSIIDDSVENMSKLKTNADGINKIAEVITNIADQTNLLALNAAIEAARAGEAGKGFAIVAEEIRKLAENSTKATGEILEIIEIIRSNVDEMAISIDHIKEEMTTSQEQSRLGEKELQKIITGVSSVSEQIEIIADGLKSMAAVSDEIVESTKNVTSIAQNTTAGTEEVSAAAEETTSAMEEMTSKTDVLTEMVARMRKSVEQFTLQERVGESD
ncbi:hypothetical protein BBF96_14530 [Anoxybacter fermentans]|uniref:Chemotaxis protein n=1 Tax=Anoxybacter fermentans TaxID=1323375 RepID=A0A3S9T1L2_9FIRM|nr:HAMP domain-containing methyl-accepting chemotaxis protein [Anoxybacter fermentans]AZR74493.1 hypothetical protein BBF96_14530 [Anoxybacter fermentans]